MQLRPLGVTDRVPPHVFFLVSAVFHYLGPAFAVLLFAHVTVLGVAWLRIASAAIVPVVVFKNCRLVKNIVCLLTLTRNHRPCRIRSAPTRAVTDI